MFTKKFWKDLAERSLRTFGQGAAAFATGITLDMVKADVKSVVIGGLIAGGYAVVTSLVAAFKNPEQQSASLLDQPVVTEPDEPDQPGQHSAEYFDGPKDSPPPPYATGGMVQGFVAQPMTGSPFQGPTTRQRDPQTGRFLPRNQGDY